MKKGLIFFISFLILNSLPKTLHAQNENAKQSLEAEVGKTKQLIVMIVADFDGAQELGPGIIVGRKKDELLIATAYHLLHIGPAQAKKIQVKFRARPDKFFEAAILKHSSEDMMDLALLTLKDLPKQDIDICSILFDRLSDTTALRRGDDVFPVGNPNGIPWAMPVGADKISDILGNNISFQSSFITKGNSGGALLDASAGIAGLVVADEPPFGRALNIESVISKLNKWGYSVNLRVRDFRGQTPLHIAADKGDTNALKTLLLEDCSNVNQRDDRQATPLHFAAYASTDGTKFLIKAGADLNLLDADGDPPLKWADESKNIENVRMLVNAGSQWGRWTPLTYAAIKGDLNMVKNLARDSNNVEKKDDHEATALHFAAAYATTEVVNLLVNSGADIDALDEDKYSPIVWAAESGRIDIIKLLLKAGAKENTSKYLLLQVAAKSGQIDVAEYLLKSGTDLNATYNGTPPISVAISNKQYEMIEFLLKSGAYVGRDALGRYKPPICTAIETGQIEIIKILIDAGVDINEDYALDLYILDCVFDANWEPNFKLELLKALVSAPSGKSSLTIKKTNVHGWSLGSIFLEEESDENFLLEAMKILIPAGADPNEAYYWRKNSDESGEWKTPLSLALENGYNKAAEFLREHGAKK